QARPGCIKRQRTAALQNADGFSRAPLPPQGFGVRLSSAAFTRKCTACATYLNGALRFDILARCSLFLAISLFGPAFGRAANLLLDPGFEDNPPGADVHPISGWQSYGANNFTESDGHAHTGANYYKVYGQFTASDNFTGLYQDNPATPGNTYSADGWAFSLST